MLPEKRVENQIKKFLDRHNAYWFKTLGGSVPAGTADIIACVNGYFIAIEVKKPSGGNVSALQEFHINKVKQSGGIAFVANSVEVVENTLKSEGVIT